MKAYCLGSSSEGNCFIFDFGEGTEPLMVECGIPWSEISKRVMMENGCPSLGSVTRCLITHAHKDHCMAWESLRDRGISRLASEDTLTIMGDCEGSKLEMLKPNDIGGGLYVLPFAVDHDIAGAVGFVIKSKSETVLFINDSKGWFDDLSNFQPTAVFAECNYWDWQAKAIATKNRQIMSKQPQGTKAYHDADVENKQIQRNVASHMSSSGCLEWLAKLDLSKCKAIMLMHLSGRYANEYEMSKAVSDRFGKPVYVCQRKGGIK